MPWTSFDFFTDMLILCMEYMLMSFSKSVSIVFNGPRLKIVLHEKSCDICDPMSFISQHEAWPRQPSGCRWNGVFQPITHERFVNYTTFIGFTRLSSSVGVLSVAEVDEQHEQKQLDP